MATRGPATLDDLMMVEKKAELINGWVVRYPLMGHKPGSAAGEILFRLMDHEKVLGVGEAFGPCLVYAVPELPSGRQSFCPDGSYHFGPWPDDRMSWIDGAPAFAVEIRVLEDYDFDSEPDRTAKRADYFLAGTKVVWDVDSLNEIVNSYRADDPSSPVVFHTGDMADAEPALPGWRLSVSDIFA